MQDRLTESASDLEEIVQAAQRDGSELPSVVASICGTARLELTKHNELLGHVRGEIARRRAEMDWTL